MIGKLIKKLFNKRRYLNKYKDTNVYLDNETMDKTGYMFSALVTYNGKETIIVDNNFLKLDTIVQKYLLEHEVGHIVNRHMYTNDGNVDIRLDAIKNNDVSPYELEADYYAIKNIGMNNYIYSVDKLIDLIDYPPGKKELMIRKGILEKIG